MPEVITAKPRIGYQNLLETTGVTIVTTSETVDYEAANAYDWKPFTFWKPAAGGAQYITATFSVEKLANYFAFYNHNIHTNSGTLSLEYSLDGGGSWIEAATKTPTDNKPVYLNFAPIAATKWRVKINSSTASQVAVVAFGMDLELERGVWIGFSPPPLARKTKTTTTVSDSGVFLGRSVVRSFCGSELALEHLSVSWIRAYWMPFVLHAEIKPFFLNWSPNKYQAEIAFCWIENADSDIDDPKHTHPTMMSTRIKFMCNVE